MAFVHEQNDKIWQLFWFALILRQNEKCQKYGAKNDSDATTGDLIVVSAYDSTDTRHKTKMRDTKTSFTATSSLL